MTTMTDIRADMLRDLPGVARVAQWKDRYYINFEGFDRSFAGDRNLKVWLRGSQLVVEGVKGTRSGALMDSFHAFISAVRPMVDPVREYGDTIEATYRFR